MNLSKTFFSLLFVLTFMSLQTAAQNKHLVVRMASLEIDSAQLDQYKAMLKESVETAVRVEPGVLTLYAVYDKSHPAHVTVFEVYADQAAYEAHLKTPHFLKYKTGTQGMVKSLQMVEVSPIALAAK
jgi:quinol monooxygenase YgiN